MDLILAGCDALNAGDLDALMESWAPDIEVDLSRALGPLTGVYRGEEAQRAFIDFCESWQSVRSEPHEFIEVGEHDQRLRALTFATSAAPAPAEGAGRCRERGKRPRCGLLLLLPQGRLTG